MVESGSRRQTPGAEQGAVEEDAVAEARRAYAALLKRTLPELVRTLAGLPEVRRVSLVGSYARGRADLFTDIDLVVVMDTNKPFVERLRILYGLLAAPVDLDVLCYTPGEFAAMRERGVSRRLFEGELVLYEKHAT